MSGVSTTSTIDSYHHGDLPAALLRAAMEILEEDGGEGFSLRAVARRAGVSTAAPYRHYADREALESAVAAEGFRDLRESLERACAEPDSVADLAELGVAYVNFALRRPALFRLMFGNACDNTNDDRVLAVSEVQQFLAAAVARVYPHADLLPLAIAGWSVVHGLAFLHLDGKLANGSFEEVASCVRSAIGAVLSVGAPATGAVSG